MPTEDTWWAFVAQIDRAALVQELPGSASDRRMREEHGRTAKRSRSPLPPVSDELALERRIELVRASRAWSTRDGGQFTRGAKEQQELEKQLAAYAVRKRQTRRAA